MQDSEPPTWSKIKKVMDVVRMLTGSLEMAGNPTVTLLVALFLITVFVPVLCCFYYYGSVV
jgi:hypothetical protein